MSGCSRELRLRSYPQGVLPGTGKDYWISRNCEEMPVVSLDDIRRKYTLSPEGPQGYVASLGKEEAKEYLRRRQPFVWNAQCEP